jgi:hypothetical protein
MGLFSRKPELIPATAIVRSAEMTPKAMRQTEKRDLEHDVDLEVTFEGGPMVRITHRCTVPWDKVPRPGALLNVAGDPAQPSRLEIDWDATPSMVDQANAAREAKTPEELAAAFGVKIAGR